MTEEFKNLRNPFEYESTEDRLTEEQASELINNPEKYFEGKTQAQRVLILSQLSVLYHESDKLRGEISKKRQ